MTHGIGTAIAHASAEEGDHWPIIQRAFEGDNLGKYLFAPHEQKNVWRACLIAANGKLPTALWQIPTSTLLNLCFPTRPCGFKTVIEKVELDVPVWTWSVLSNIMRTDEHSAAMLMKSPKIRRNDVSYLMRLPSSCRFLLAHNMIFGGDNGRCAADLEYLAGKGADTSKNVDRLKAMVETQSWSAIHSREVFYMANSSTFPDPPIGKMTKFKPIVSGRQLLEVSKKYSNLVYDYLRAISDGDYFLYEYSGVNDILILLNTEHDECRIIQMQAMTPEDRSYCNQIAILMISEAAAVGKDLSWGEFRTNKIEYTSCMGAD